MASRLEHTIVIVNASISNWIEPWASKIGIETVLATEISIKNNLITGYFSSPNRYGQEKVNHLLTVFPNKSEYILYANGDSSGDKELLALPTIRLLL
ncbi:HAD-IB family phosphatase [Dysgonomonas sp. GY617]|uniref:HAD-IB family phosphatase n=1 Tax=Dysgonomonas sp. GY617 TaxID=2780420 RepID=UPI001883CA73|nr:HAD-IB family phosphatase [Dysgonomonas sp. GY617]MBF0575990.1 HAD-IB family phosphatase [Dysgonomonas sp. GY617]